MAASRRQFILSAGAAGLSTACRAAAIADEVTPETFGAKGDGRTNDSKAFAAMSAHVNARGGGTIVLRPVTYVLGEQHPVAGNRELSYAAADNIRLAGCHRPVRIEGNGARLRCAGGLRYGRFDPHSGNPLPEPEKPELGSQAVPYFALIDIQNCMSSVQIDHVELDGNIQGLRIGGRVWRTGWQAGASGIRLIGNRGPERLSRIHSHHHAQDGLILAPASDRTGSTTVTDLVSDYNGRQGCSITGGRNFVFQRCLFRRTGRAVLHSDPGAGVDIEEEMSAIRNVAFSECQFSDNTGFGVVAGGGDSADIRFERCRFVGTTNWAAWPESPLMRFSECVFVGSLNHLHADANPERAAQFVGCTFTDDAALSPTGKVFLGPDGGRWIVVMDRHDADARFTRCHFRLIGEGLLPLSAAGVIYADCDMSQRSPTASSPRGTYVGQNSIRGNAHLEGSVIRGEVMLNGRPVPRTG
jgi:hypothetical protein